MICSDTVVWLSPDKQSRLLLSPSVGEGICLLRQNQISGLWEAESSLSLSDEEAIALYGLLAKNYSPGPEAAEDVPQPLQRLGTAALLIEAVEAAYWASALGGDLTSESADRRLNCVAGEINRRLYQYLQPSPWIRVGETLYNVSQLRLVNRGMPELFDFLNRQAQQY